MMEEKLKLIDDNSSIQTMTPVSGGDINRAYYIKTEKQEYFVKANQNTAGDFFKVEADGLERIRSTKTIAVPEVYYYDKSSENQEMVLIMQWIHGKKTATTEQQLGDQLALFHLADGPAQYGLDRSTYIGKLPQPNGWHSDWVDYFRDHRLQPQLDLSIHLNRMNQKRRLKLEKLIHDLNKYLPNQPRVSLLHGDLWGGNWITGHAGKPYLIDPSVFYGDHLFELAFTELFGGFSDIFYTQYKKILPLEDYYEDVKPIYQLYYLLVHLNMFGEAYGTSVDTILKRYIR
ncbi:fructosamine kinase family protein [Oceanobacillus neutriphilus]|uniref:Fructosamine kinase n=1 Tax=Oceanobacillus neutriphilus TaxID=531815 RepID=A0ABQ2NTS9_9BACI|nr:fructosamine kinase family protein [Oceanobacillus neutriphilus]GGP10363.1 fructosamine kinase [Oceanobacillus neutriphilus]